MALSREDVEKVALLARLRLSDDELEKMTTQLGQVLGYIQQLDELDTTGIEPLAHSLDLVNVFAKDELHASLPRDKALAAAPKSDNECFLVPAVLGD
jgi:aspartyl-tRNA(Asn)/glutamyl-tRNA(Gln) amidotransferase subunit C